MVANACACLHILVTVCCCMALLGVMCHPISSCGIAGICVVCVMAVVVNDVGVFVVIIAVAIAVPAVAAAVGRLSLIVGRWLFPVSCSLVVGPSLLAVYLAGACLVVFILPFVLFANL